MTIKNLFALTTVLGAAALLQNKQRRDKFFTTAKDLLQNKERRDQLLSSAKDLIGNARNRLGATHAAEPSMATSTTGTPAGY